jgi:DNA-binding transcriptional regulator YiaG
VVATPDRQAVEHLADELRQAELPSPRKRRAIREDAGASLRDVAAVLDTSPETIRRWESKTTPRREHAIAYRNLLDALEAVAE